MDGLSAASSAFAVVSIALQLADSFKTLYDFFETVQGAPDDIRSKIKDLKLLASILDNMAGTEDPMIQEALESCLDKVKTLVNFVTAYEKSLGSKSKRIRKWSAFKVTLQADKIKSFREVLEEAKSTLTLAQAHSTHCMLQSLTFSPPPGGRDNCGIRVPGSLPALSASDNSDLFTADLRREIERAAAILPNSIIRARFVAGITKALNENFKPSNNVPINNPQAVGEVRNKSERTVPGGDGSVVGIEDCSTKSHAAPLFKRRNCHSSYYTKVSTIFGTIEATHWVYQLFYPGDDIMNYEKEYETITNFRIKPSPWMVWCGFAYALAGSTQGWQTKLQVCNTVPDDSLIFALCRMGDFAGVKSLLDGKLASPYDVDSNFRTPLHYAAKYSHAPVCGLLMDFEGNAGAIAD